MPHLQWTLCQRCVTLRRCLGLSHLKPVISLWPREEDVCLDILLSSSIRLTGSVTAGSGTWARLIALQMMSFIWLWRCCLGAFLRQSSPSNPRASTGFPHTHAYLQNLQPSRWATATLMASPDSLSLTAVIGGAWSQSPEWGEEAARSLAVSTSLPALGGSSARCFTATSQSRAFCICWTSVAGLVELFELAHKA